MKQGALIVILAWLVIGLPAAAEQPVSGKLLVAARATGGVFKHSLIYLIEHGEDGSLGLIVNRPTPALLKDMAPRFAEIDRQGHAVNYGGPVGLGALKFIVRDQVLGEDAISVDDGVHASGSPELLENLLRSDLPPQTLLIFVGYAGWAPGQLDGELKRKVWHVLSASAEFVFTTTDSSWQQLIEELEPRGLQARMRVTAGNDPPG